MTEPEGGSEGEINPYFDAANRLERTVDIQIDVLNGIDDKTEHVTRLVGTLLTIVLSVLLFVSQSTQRGIGEVSIGTAIAFSVGILSLLLTIGAGILTYLRSEFRVGVSAGTAQYLLERETMVNTDEHLLSVINVYKNAISFNQPVVSTNANRFVWTLYFLFIGVFNLALAAVLYVSGIVSLGSWGILIADVVACAALAIYVHRGKYLPHETQGEGEE